MITELQKLTLALIATGSALILIGLWLDDQLTRRRTKAGWERAARQLGRQLAMHGQYMQQLADHVGHLAAEVERLKLDQAQAARRPPIDPTLRLVVDRTTQMPRIGGKSA